MKYLIKVCNYYDCLKVVYGAATGLKFFEWSVLLFCLCCFVSLLPWLPTQTVIFDYTLDVVLEKQIVIMI